MAREVTSAALPYMLLVDGEFHSLHIQLRAASKGNDEKKWRENAEKFAQHIEEILEHKVFASDLEHEAPRHLPRGRLSLGDTSTLLSIYASSALRWKNFAAGRNLQKHLVCALCARGWVKQFRSNNIHWHKRTEKGGHPYIVGNTGRTRSCNVNFNIYGYACHPKKGPYPEPGYRCTGTESTPLYPLHGVALCVENGNYDRSNRLYFKELRDDSSGFPGYVTNNITSVEDYSYDSQLIDTHRFNSFSGLIDVENEMQHNLELITSIA